MHRKAFALPEGGSIGKAQGGRGRPRASPSGQGGTAYNCCPSTLLTAHLCICIWKQLLSPSASSSSSSYNCSSNCSLASAHLHQETIRPQTQRRKTTMQGFQIPSTCRHSFQVIKGFEMQVGVFSAST